MKQRLKLALVALVKYISGLVLVSALLFIPAGSTVYFGAYLFIALLFIPMLILGIFLLVKSPDVLEKRLDSKEKEGTQKGILALSGLMFIIGFLVAGLDFRFGWSYVPSWIVIIASIVLILSYALYAEVMRENAYISRTVRVHNGQTVVDKGLYGIIRHPMYAVTVWLFLSIPLILGSWWAFLCFTPYIPIIAVRIVNEEKVLARELKGYTEYMKKVKYRLIPLVW